MGPIWATRIWANPYGTHAKPGCTLYGTHIGMFAGEVPLKNILLEGLNRFNGANLALNSDVDQDT